MTVNTKNELNEYQWMRTLSMDHDEMKLTKSIDILYDLYQQAEINIIMQILRQLLKREPNDDDYPKVQRIFRYGIIDSYVLAYDGKPLGIIKKGFANDIINKYNVTFTPY